MGCGCQEVGKEEGLTVALRTVGALVIIDFGSLLEFCRVLLSFFLDLKSQESQEATLL